MPKAPPIKASTSALTPTTYKALKTEQGVFTTPPYSANLKDLWKFKDADTAAKSSEALWERFKGYREQEDFVGMDMCRKFIQMGRTRSLRYALRKGGRKYEHSSTEGIGKGKGKDKATAEDSDEKEDHEKRGKEIPRTGEVYDQGKLEGANIFEGYLDRCWDDEVYSKAWTDWREAGKRKSGSVTIKGKPRTQSTVKAETSTVS